MLTGYSGFSDRRSDLASPLDRVSEMAAGLRNHGDTIAETMSASAMAIRCADTTIASDKAAGIVCAIDGAPDWQRAKTKELAQNHGNAQALLAEYRRYGDQFLNAVNGKFSFAVIDERASRVLLAVDRMGINALCYSVLECGTIAFGSTIAAILANRSADARLSPQSLFDYIYFHVVPSPRTIYESINKIEPAHYILFENGQLLTKRYWKPDSTPDTAIDRHSVGRLLRKQVRTAIGQCHPDERTGAFLSGGLDSSTVCGMANELLDEPLPAYVIGFDQDGYDEVPYARIAARHFHLNLREYYVTPEDVRDTLPLIATAYDEPFGNSSAVPAFLCARLARSDGLGRLLAGDGGDELFAGNERYVTQRYFEYYHRVPRLLREYGVEPAALRLPLNSWLLLRKARRYIEQARIPMPQRLQTYNLLHMHNPEEIFEPAFLESVDESHPLRSMEEWYARGDDGNLIDAMLQFDWKLTLADNDIRKVSTMCAAAGIRVDYPLLHHDLVAFSARIPEELKIRNNKLRYSFKFALNDYLPPEIINKQKHGFGLPFGEWLTSAPELADIVEPAIESLAGRGIVLGSFIEQLLLKHRTEHAAFYGNIIWVLLALELWLQGNSRMDD